MNTQISSFLDAGGQIARIVLVSLWSIKNWPDVDQGWLCSSMLERSCLNRPFWSPTKGDQLFQHIFPNIEADGPDSSQARHEAEQVLQRGKNGLSLRAREVEISTPPLLKTPETVKTET